MNHPSQCWCTIQRRREEPGEMAWHQSLDPANGRRRRPAEATGSKPRGWPNGAERGEGPEDEEDFFGFDQQIWKRKPTGSCCRSQPHSALPNPFLAVLQLLGLLPASRKKAEGRLSSPWCSDPLSTNGIPWRKAGATMERFFKFIAALRFRSIGRMEFCHH